jgi:hypothetical protein
MKVYGRQSQDRVDWDDVICFVSYRDNNCHQKIVEDSFQYHFRLDLEYIKQHHPDHFLSPYNVARAVLLYHYFREHHYFFDEVHWEYISHEDLPDREPDSDGKGYRLWVIKQPANRQQAVFLA